MYDGGLQRCKYLKTNKKNKKNQSNFEAREIFKKKLLLDPHGDEYRNITLM